MKNSISIQECSPRKKTVWIADDLTEKIFTGEFSGKIPSESDLAKVYEVNFKTVSRAISILVEKGLVYRKRPQGTFVSEGNRPQASIWRRNGEKIALLLMRTQGHIFENLASALIEKLGEKGFTVTVCNLSGEIITELQHARIVKAIKANPELIIAGHTVFSADELNLMERHAAKVIHLSRRPFVLGIDTNADFVLSDIWYGGYIATKYLIEERQRRHILFLSHVIDQSEPMVEFRHTNRYLISSGYRDAMLEAGLESNISECSYSSKGRSLSDAITGTDAVFSTSDHYIIQNIKLIREFNLKQSHEIDLVGYSNTPWSQGETPFSSISLREDILVENIVEHAVGSKHGTSIIKPELIKR